MGKLVAGVGINDADYAVVRFSDPDENGIRKTSIPVSLLFSLARHVSPVLQ